MARIIHGDGGRFNSPQHGRAYSSGFVFLNKHGGGKIPPSVFHLKERPGIFSFYNKPRPPLKMTAGNLMIIL
jgi:hypothetical protein